MSSIASTSRKKRPTPALLRPAHVRLAPERRRDGGGETPRRARRVPMMPAVSAAMPAAVTSSAREVTLAVEPPRGRRQGDGHDQEKPPERGRRGVEERVAEGDPADDHREAAEQRAPPQAAGEAAYQPPRRSRRTPRSVAGLVRVATDVSTSWRAPAAGRSARARVTRRATATTGPAGSLVRTADPEIARPEAVEQ